MIVRVAVPVKIARLRVWVDKARHWNPVDQLLLWALSQKPRSSQQLAQEAGIPTRLVNEIVLNLMRAGWVELAALPSGVAFRATDEGKSAAEDFESLPVIRRPAARRISFIFEPFLLSAFQQKEMKYYRRGEIEAIAQQHDVRRIVLAGAEFSLTAFRLHDAAEKILSDIAGDEELLSVDPKASTLADGFTLISVVGDKLKGLPPNAPSEMREAVRRAVKSSSAHAFSIHPNRLKAEVADSADYLPAPTFDFADLLLSGADHREAIVDVLAKASYNVVIHSTFLNFDVFKLLQEDFRNAARRGVKIDVFWGAASADGAVERNSVEATKINQFCNDDIHMRNRVLVHMKSTDSHAKLLLADTGRPDQYLAIVGSCNWLWTRFNRVEISAIFREPHIVARIATMFAELIYSAIPASEVASLLNRIVRGLRKFPPSDGKASLGIIAGDRHVRMIHSVRDKAVDRIVFGSDRFGNAAEAKTIIPLIAASKRSVKGSICYSRPSGGVTRGDAKAMQAEVLDDRVRLIPIPSGELHGKFLLWDKDDIVITSLNWSSADIQAGRPHGEIGIHINSPGVADHIATHLSSLWPELSGGSNTAERRKKRRRRKKTSKVVERATGQ